MTIKGKLNHFEDAFVYMSPDSKKAVFAFKDELILT